MTAFDVLSESHQLGLTLRAKDNGKLGFKPERLCSPEFREKLRAHKPQLLALLQTKGLTWTEVFSERIGETIFFCEDEDTKAALTEAGAEPWSIYTRAELRQLIQQNRIEPISSAELRKLHEIKRTFHGRIARGNGG
jgi:TubC N-terminal docking domain